MLNTTRSEILDEFLACPYCGEGPKSEDDWKGCCGESSAHYVRAYVVRGYDDNPIFEEEIRITDDSPDDRRE